MTTCPDLCRRQLTPSQRAMVAARAKEYYERQAKERMSAGGGDKKSTVAKSGRISGADPISGARSRDEAGAAVGVSGITVDRVRAGKTLVVNCSQVLTPLGAKMTLPRRPGGHQGYRVDSLAVETWRGYSGAVVGPLTYEAIHPEAKRPQGGRLKQNAENISTFADDTASTTGRTARSVRGDVALADSIPDDVAEAISG